jgi:hypothetical protein
MLQKGYKKLDLRRKWIKEFALNAELTNENNSYNKS